MNVAKIAIVNNSTLISDVEAEVAAEAVEQMMADVAATWARLAPGVQFEGRTPTSDVTVAVLALVDDAGQVGALGWHEEDSGRYVGTIQVKPILDAGGVALYDPKNPNNYSVSATLGHEAAELFGDPTVNLYADGPKIEQGNSYAVELCDPCESFNYVKTVGGHPVFVSDFLLPAYFDPQATKGPFDYLGNLTGPFSMGDGGYYIVRGITGEQQVFGEKPPPAWRLAAKRASRHSRSTRRLRLARGL